MFRLDTFFMKYVSLGIFFVGSSVTLLNAAGGQGRIQKVQEAALQQEQKQQEKNSGIDNRSLIEIEDQAGDNRFTQTEGYLQVPALRDMVSDTFGGSFAVVNHMDIISRVLTKEVQLKKTHWAFYHATSNKWLVPQDLFTLLDRAMRPSAQKEKDFTFLRFFEGKSGVSANDFLTTELKKNGLVDDNGEASGILLSTNVSLFGNTGFKSESTWRYFMKEKEHTAPDREIYKGILDTFKVSHKYIDEVMALVDLLAAKEQTLYQIFVPKEDVDDVAYLAWATGIPAHDDTIDWIRTNLKNKVYKGKKGKPGALWALADLKDKFKNQQEKNPLFKDMLKSIQEGDYSLNSFLKVYCNKPWELPNMNYVQARLLFSKEGLLNPSSGVKMYRYTTVSRSKTQEYKKRLDAIVKKMVKEKGISAAAA